TRRNESFDAAKAQVHEVLIQQHKLAPFSELFVPLRVDAPAVVRVIMQWPDTRRYDDERPATPNKRETVIKHPDRVECVLQNAATKHRTEIRALKGARGPLGFKVHSDCDTIARK